MFLTVPLVMPLALVSLVLQDISILESALVSNRPNYTSNVFQIVETVEKTMSAP